MPGIEILQAEWELETDPNLRHLAYFKNNAILARLFGRLVQRTRASAKITFYGPAGVVTFRFTIPDMGEMLMFQTHLPTAPLAQKVDFHLVRRAQDPRPLVSYVIGNWVSQWQNDVGIWERRIHRERPLLVQEDDRSCACAAGSPVSTPTAAASRSPPPRRSPPANSAHPVLPTYLARHLSRPCTGRRPHQPWRRHPAGRSSP